MNTRWTQKQLLLRRFKENGNRLTLGQLLEPPLGAAYRGRISDLREDGFDIRCYKRKPSSYNLYVNYGSPLTLQNQAIEHPEQMDIIDRLMRED